MTTGRAIRKPAVAGSFYPADPRELRAAVKAYLDRAEGDGASVPKAIIAPHAGYIYSGPIAATADPFLFHVFPDGGEAAEDLPGAVDVVDPPAAVP